jgi:hypothetical protein
MPSFLVSTFKIYCSNISIDAVDIVSILKFFIWAVVLCKSRIDGG